jgi:hypothetical protein
MWHNVNYKPGETLVVVYIMKKDFYIYEIFRAKNTVFTPTELALLWREKNKKNLYERLRYYKETEKLLQIKKGFYAKDKDYERFEFGTKHYKPSYISLNTVLQMEGIIFQYYETIYLSSYLSREITVDEQNYNYKKISNEILLNPKGLIEKEFYYIASKERAFLDAVYLYKDYYFDNLNPLNWEFCFELLEIYSNKQMKKRVEKYYRDYKEELA